MSGRSGGWIGRSILALVFGFSILVSLYHVWTHDASLLATVLGQWSLVGLAVVFGIVGYSAQARVETPTARDTIGRYAGAGYVLAGVASGGYSLHQYLTPEAELAADVLLFEATFVALVGGTAGVVVGLEKARRVQSIADLEATTRELDAIQQSVRTEKRRFESLFQNSPAAVADVRFDGERLLVERGNDVFEALLDATVQDVDHDLFELLPLDARVTEDEVVAHVADSERYEGEVTLDRDGERRHFKLRVSPYDVGQEGDRAFALYTDVTELRRTRRELSEYVDRLEASNERLEQFAYGISHDLREPLRMISSYLHLLEEQEEADLDDDAREYIEYAVDGADRMRKMIDSLLQYSRVTTRGDPLEPTDADGVLNDVLTDLGPRIEATDATVTTDELPTVRADPDQLAQVFRNLLSNALKYSGDEPPEIHVGVERADAAWQFSVADQGVGLEPEQRDRIFGIFETAHTTDEGSGSGIGLALCERIVERHDGDIWVDSVPGEGSTFYFTIPSTQDEASV